MVKGRNLEESINGKIILVDLKEIGWESVDWMRLAQDRG
jgi:hypothetical protein